MGPTDPQQKRVPLALETEDVTVSRVGQRHGRDEVTYALIVSLAEPVGLDGLPTVRGPDVLSHEGLVFEWVPSEILHPVIGARCQCDLRVRHDLGLRFRGSERSAGSSLIDSQVRRTRDLAVIFTAYESVS